MRFRDKDFIDIGSKLVRKKTIHQFHERPHQIDTRNTVIPEDDVMQNENSELTYNDIYKQISSPEHTHDIYKNNIGLEKKRDQISIKSGVPFSSNNPRENIYNNKDKGQNQGKLVFYYVVCAIVTKCLTPL